MAVNGPPVSLLQAAQEFGVGATLSTVRSAAGLPPQGGLLELAGKSANRQVGTFTAYIRVMEDLYVDVSGPELHQNTDEGTAIAFQTPRTGYVYVTARGIRVYAGYYQNSMTPVEGWISCITLQERLGLPSEGEYTETAFGEIWEKPL